tara:strand:- start:521 stop:799 length:279 start_codon:yes stop_codon:yes gene_type:complete
MSNLYYLKYHQESEVYIEADSEDEARQKIDDYTKGGGDNMYNIRLNECGWRVVESYDELTPVKVRDNFGHSHTTADGREWGETDIPDGYYEW